MPNREAVPVDKSTDGVSEAGLAAFLQQFRGDLGRMANVTAWYEVAAQAPTWSAWPINLDKHLIDALANLGVQRPYSHQS